MNENQSKTRDISYRKPINEIVKVVRKHHLNYEQLQNVLKSVRHKCDLKPTKKRTGAKEHLSKDEAQKLINHAYSMKGIIGLVIKTLLFTGVRVNEFVNIKLSNIYFEEKKIYIEKGKGNKSRYVPIFDFYLHELRVYINSLNRSKGYLFESNRHTKYSTRRIQQILKQICSETGIDKKITPHRLRATIGIWLYEKGMPKDDIQLFYGHSKSDTTQIYLQGSVKNIGEKGNKLLLGEEK